MFTWSDRELNAEQSEAVRDPGNVFLVACPGSGKTRTLAYKIAYELANPDLGKRFVVAITYTHRAADEIRERIESLGVETDKLWIGTIHSFCLEWVLKPYRVYEPALAHGFRIVDQHDREKLLEALCIPFRAQRVTTYDCDYYFSADGYHLGCQQGAKHPAIHQILGNYFRHLSDNRQIDFELMLWYGHKLATQNPAIPKLLSELFSFILVDEYQDTKQIQYALLGSILSAGAGATRLFMVGDPNQAIYGSLGGYPIEIDELRAICGIEIHERFLSANYRSSDRIVSYFSNFNVFNTQIEAVGDLRNYPSIVTYNRAVSRDGLAAEVARVIRHSVEHLGVPANEICVLAPQWIHLASMTRRLVTGMPGYQFDGPGLLPFARDTENFWYKVARLALTEPSPALYGRRLRWASEIVRDMADAGIETSRLTPKSFLRACNSIAVDDAVGLSYLSKFFDALFAQIHVRIADFPQLSEHHLAFFEGSEARAAKLRAEGVAGFAELAFFKKVFQSRSGIHISTIHGVKGAEFDVVIAYALLEGMVPHFADADGDTASQKLLYVIGSRARKNLHLFSETGRARGHYGQTYAPTIRLERCAFAYDRV